MNILLDDSSRKPLQVEQIDRTENNKNQTKDITISLSNPKKQEDKEKQMKELSEEDNLNLKTLQQIVQQRKQSKINQNGEKKLVALKQQDQNAQGSQQIKIKVNQSIKQNFSEYKSLIFSKNSDIQNPYIIRKWSKKIDILSGIIAFILSIISYIENEIFRNYNYRSDQLCTFFRSIIIILILFLDFLILNRYRIIFNQQKQFKKQSMKTQLLTILYMLIELIISSFFIPPYVDKYYTGEMINGTYVYSLNDLACMVSFIKNYTLIRLYYHLSRWTTEEALRLCEQNNVQNNILFLFKCEMKYRPIIALLFILTFLISFFALLIRIVEINYESYDENNFDLDNALNAYWLVSITMTTIGYGDIYPQTHIGRSFGIVSGLLGMLLVSYFVMGMSNLFDLNSQEFSAYNKLKRIIAQEEAMQKAANVVRTAFKINQNKVQSRTRKKNIKLHKTFIYYLQLKKDISIFKNSNKIVNSRLLATDQMIQILKDKLKKDIEELKEDINQLQCFNSKCQNIEEKQQNSTFYYQELLLKQIQIQSILKQIHNENQQNQELSDN